MTYPLRFRYCIAPALAFSLLGCSMHPLPENFPLNFPRASTFDIVQKVRCEAKAGLERFKNSKNKEHVASIIAATSIGYDFQFTMIEDNNAAGGALNFLRRPANKASKGSLEVGVTGSAERKRKNKRTFRIVEALGDVEKADCPAEARANLAYPISGTLRVDEIVNTYIRLERISDLEPLDKQPDVTEDVETREKPRTAVFSEHLQFKTTLTSGATPTLKLSAVAGSFRLTNATVHGVATRSDDHSLIIAFAQDPDFNDEKVKRARDERKKIIGRKLVRGARAETALAQGSSEFARNRLVLELARLRNLLDDEEEGAKFLGERLLKFLRPPDETGPGE